MRTHFVEALLVLTLISFARCASASPIESQPKRPISEPEFLHLFQDGHTIENRIVDAKSIVKALKWARQEAVSGKRKGPLPGLGVSNSIIEGPLDLEDLDVGTDVEELSPDLTEWGRKLGIYAAITIPIQISFNETIFRQGIGFKNVVFRDTVEFIHCTFEGSTWSTNTFQNVVFQKTAFFDGSTFQNLTSFENILFQQEAGFLFTTFRSSVVFTRASFSAAVNFTGGTFQGTVGFNYPTFDSWVHFSGATFLEETRFGGAQIRSTVTFQNSTFRKYLLFADLNNDDSGLHGYLKFPASSFSGGLYLVNCKVDRLSFSAQPLEVVLDALEQVEWKEERWPDETNAYVEELRKSSSRGSSVPTHVEKQAVFSGLLCNSADFSETEFHDFVDLGKAKFSEFANFRNVSFERGANFYQTEFPFSTPPAVGQGRVGLILDGLRIQKPFNLEWDQVNGRVDADTTETWIRLENAFKQSGNLKGQNESMYRLSLRQGAEYKDLWSRLTNRLMYFYWGYGVRPFRLALWMLVVFLMFTAAYWTQTGSLVAGKNWFKGQWDRLRFAFNFSVRTSWSIGHGYKNARTPIFKAVTILHSIGFKLMLLSLFKALSNTSPLLNEFLEKLIRI